MLLIVYDFREQGFSVCEKAIFTEGGPYELYFYTPWQKMILANFTGFLCL